MKTFGVRELTEQINEILRMVEEEGETIELTNHGEVVARLVPARRSEHPIEVSGGAIWADFDRLAAELGVDWPDISAVDAVRDIRRGL